MRFPARFVTVPPAEWVGTDEKAQEALEYLSLSRLPLAIDTETSGLRRSSDIVYVWSISNGIRRFTIHTKYLKMFSKLLREFPDISMHNSHYDRSVLMNTGVDTLNGCVMGRIHDTLVQHSWLDQNVSHDLADIAEHDLNLFKLSFREMFQEKKGERPVLKPDMFSDESYLAKVVEYASWDAYVTALLRARNDHLLDKRGLLKIFNEVEAPFSDAVFAMERNGILVDRALLEQYAPLYEERISQIEQEFNRYVGSPINLRSPTQLRDLFYRKLKKPVEKVTKSSSDDDPIGSTDASVLKQWASEGDYLAKLLLEFRTLDKQYGTYIKGILERLDSRNMLYTEFNQHVAATGRLSSSDPNLQNIIGDDKIPDYLQQRGVSFRKIFIPEDGYIFLDADYNQIEMVLGALFSGDESLLDAIRTGKDLHCLTVAKFFNVPYEDVYNAKKKSDRGEELTDREHEILKFRKLAKTINFGIFYGMGPRLLAERTGVSLDQAKNFISMFFAVYPGVRTYVRRQEKQVLENGYVTTYLGRQRKINGAQHLDPEISSMALREAVNTPIQGSAADVLRGPMINLAFDKYLREMGVKIRLQIHDELLFTVPDNEDKEKIAEYIREAMEHPFASDLGVPLRVQYKFGYTWADAK